MGSARHPAMNGRAGNSFSRQKKTSRRACALQLMNANIDRYAVEVGQTVHVKFDCAARQWENRWFNTLTAWEVVVIKEKEEKPV